MNDKEERVIITKSEYILLRRDAHTLSLLEAAGVDNWDGCEEAFDDFKLYEFQEGDAEHA